MNTKFIIRKLNELNDQELDVINFHRQKEFGALPRLRDSLSDPTKWTQIMLKDEQDNIIAIAGLWEITVIFMGREYPIWGIASVISIIKGAGYGKMVQHEVQRIIRESGKAGIGFCSIKNGEFYRKCGYEIYHLGNHRFVYHKSDDDLRLDPELGDVLYLDGKDGLMAKFRSNPEEFIFHYVPHW